MTAEPPGIDENKTPTVKGFDPELVAAVWERMKSNPALGRMTLMREYGLKISRARRLARELKIAAGVDPSWRASHHSVSGPMSSLNTNTHIPATDAQRVSGTPDLSIEVEPGRRVAQGIISCKFAEADTLDELHRLSETDLEMWEPYRHRINRWGSAENPCWQVRCEYRLREKAVTELQVEAAIETLREESPRHKPFPASDTRGPRALEISIMDPHIGGLFFEPGADAPWSLDHCRRMWFHGIDESIRRSRHHGPFSEVVLPIGNDFLHADNVFHTTTAGTGQPEMVSWQYAAKYGAQLLIETVLYLLEEIECPIVIPVIPGNHARQTEFMLGMVIAARFWHDDRVRVDDSAEPYKAWQWGCNMIAFEHGHSVPVIRLASLMAQTWPEMFVATDGGFREWHIGDQHRKGAPKPLIYEEQGVSVEGIPGLTPGNEWHKLKSFNNQQRACAVAFVYDKSAGPVAKFPVMVNSKTNLPLGSDSLGLPAGSVVPANLTTTAEVSNG